MTTYGQMSRELDSEEAMSATEETPPPSVIDPAKLRKGARDELAYLAVTRGVIDALQNVVDENWSDVYRSEERLREIFARLGWPQLVDGPFDIGAVGAWLNEMDAAQLLQLAAADLAHLELDAPG